MKISINNSTRKGSFVLLIYLLMTCSCKKQDAWLDAKRNNSDVTPKTLQDFQAVLDNNDIMNADESILGLVGSDNILIPDANLDAADETSRNAYLWNKDIYGTTTTFDWYYSYQAVEYANIVLDGLKSIPVNESVTEYNNIKGSALFFRAYAFYQLCQLYTKPYNKVTAGADLGIPLRESSNVDQKYPRSTLSDSYQKILTDLSMSTSLLPETPLYRTRPSNIAAYALLAKVFLSMGDYANALAKANKALDKFNTLLDYNKLTITSSNPFPSFAKGNPEIIFFATAYGTPTVWTSSSVKARVAPELYQSYENGDLRRSALFLSDGKGFFRFKASYSANAYNFCGLATNELYLIRAECNARLGNIALALTDLNLLRKNRFTPAVFNQLQTTDPVTLIKQIIVERQKEMPFTGNLRWDDLKRLNLDNNYAKQLSRQYHSVNYSLLPNDPRYVLPLPVDEINLDGLQQNIR